MLTFKTGQTVRLPVVLTDATTGQAVNGVLYTQVQATVCKADGTLVDLTIGPSDWAQLTQSAYSQKGYYNLIVPASVCDQPGILQVGVAVSGADFFPGVVDLRSALTDDVYSRIGVPVLADISHDIQAISAGTGSGGFQPTDRDMMVAIKAKTDNLPSDPASNTYISSTCLTQAIDRLNLNAIKTKTDNLPSIPASQGDVTSARDNVNTNTNNARDNVNSTTNARAGEIKGGSFGSGDDLHSVRAAINTVSAKTANIPSDPATETTLTAMKGTGFDTATDSLHQLQLAQAGAGSGGFGVQDRADLQACLAQANLIGTTTVATQSDVVNNVAAARDTVMGVDTTNSPYNVKRTVSECYVYLRNTIAPQTGMIRSGGATTSEVNAARDYLAGSGFSSTTDTLHQIAAAITASNYTSADRTLMNNIYTRLGTPVSADLSHDIAGVAATANTIASDTASTRLKTSNLPVDPASNSHIDSVLGGGANVFTSDDHNMLIDIKAKTSLLPNDPASQSAGFGTSDRNTMAAIQYKTDALPPDPASNTAITNLSNKVGTPNVTVAQDVLDLNDIVLAGS